MGGGDENQMISMPDCLDEVWEVNDNIVKVNQDCDDENLMGPVPDCYELARCNQEPARNITA